MKIERIQIDKRPDPYPYQWVIYAITIALAALLAVI